MRLTIILLTTAAFAQVNHNVVQTGLVDAHAANWIPPTATFASPPSSPATGAVYIFTDASAVPGCVEVYNDQGAGDQNETSGRNLFED